MIANAIRHPLLREPETPLRGLGGVGVFANPAFRGVPQFPQNLALASLSRPQLGHFIGGYL